jgi:hypothetical protein
VEQLVARWAHNPKVAGSNPAPATIKAGIIKKMIPAFVIMGKIRTFAAKRQDWFESASPALAGRYNSLVNNGTDMVIFSMSVNPTWLYFKVIPQENCTN